MGIKKISLLSLLLVLGFQNKVVSQDAIHQNPVDKNLVLGKFDYKTNAFFIKVSPEHASKTLYLNKETYTAFCNMYNHAKKDSIDLKIISGTRNFNAQKAIWERKWSAYKNLPPIDSAKKILEYSSMPTTSRHHWGTDIDLNNLNNSYFNKDQGKKEYEWLVKNANNYGFYQVYTPKESGRTGYNLENWHWSYLPLAKKYLDFYNTHISYKDIIGFEGSELAETLNTITNYVNGISEQLKDMPTSH